MTKNSILAEGFVVVPIEPTEEMSGDASGESPCDSFGFEAHCFPTIWKAALNVRPRSQDARLAAAEKVIEVARFVLNYDLPPAAWSRLTHALGDFDSTTAKDEAG